MVTHSGIKPHACKICEKTFPRTMDLRNHVFKHTGAKNFHCTLCDKSFSKGTNLRKHIITHGERSHKCNECGKAFFHLGTLKNHLVIHSKDVCVFCLSEGILQIEPFEGSYGSTFQ